MPHNLGCMELFHLVSMSCHNTIYLCAFCHSPVCNWFLQGLKRMMKGGYKDGKMATPEEVSQLLKQYSKTQDMVQA